MFFLDETFEKNALMANELCNKTQALKKQLSWEDNSEQIWQNT